MTCRSPHIVSESRIFANSGRDTGQRAFAGRARQRGRFACGGHQRGIGAAGWAGEDPIGKRIKRVRPGAGEFSWLTVVGVIKDVKRRSI